MFSKKICASLLILGSFAQPLSVLGVQDSQFERKTMILTLVPSELKYLPGYAKQTITTISPSTRLEVIGKEVRFNGTLWIKVSTQEGEGWLETSNLAQEEYYSMTDRDQTVFVRETTSLASSTQDLCTTSTPSNISNIATNFRESKKEFSYTPIETVRTSIDSTLVTTNGATITDLRTKLPLFKYVVDQEVKQVEETPLLTTVTGFVTSSFRKMLSTFLYTPSETVRENVESVVVSSNGAVTSDFRTNRAEFVYTPSETVRENVESVVVSSNGAIASDFRTNRAEFVYTPSETIRENTESVVVSSNGAIASDFRTNRAEFVYTPSETTPTYSCVQTK